MTTGRTDDDHTATRTPGGDPATGTTADAAADRTTADAADRRAGAPRLGFAMGLVAVVAFVAAALGIGVPATPAEQVAVDEPQYLMTAQSLWRDGDLDIANQMAGSWREFTAVEPPVETVPRPDGSHVSPHDPLLPILLAAPVGLGGWAGAKLAQAALAAALAAL
ncbi:MAG TPA: hypothetical protein VGD67_01785, partial [Pseudonocardiaceae bacterium]